MNTISTSNPVTMTIFDWTVRFELGLGLGIGFELTALNIPMSAIMSSRRNTLQVYPLTIHGKTAHAIRPTSVSDTQ